MTKEKNGDAETVPAALLFRYISESGMTQAEFGKKINELPQTITNWKRRGIPRGKLMAVAHAMNLSAEQYVRESGARPRKSASFKRVAHAGADVSISVPILEVEGSMGGGRVVSAEPVIGGMQISREWARGHLSSVTSFANLAVITAFGDSMAPTFSDGDILLVDRGVNEVKIDAVYVIGRGDELFVKRVQRRLNGEIVIRSDNPLFEAEAVRGAEIDGVRVLGRVVWAWNGRRL